MLRAVQGNMIDLLGIPFEMLGLRAAVEVPFVEASGEVPRGEKMLYSGTDPESYTTECTSVYEDNQPTFRPDFWSKSPSKPTA